MNPKILRGDPAQNYHSYHSHFSNFPKIRLSRLAAQDDAACPPISKEPAQNYHSYHSHFSNFPKNLARRRGELKIPRLRSG
jgi:hypothetical protein